MRHKVNGSRWLGATLLLALVFPAAAGAQIVERGEIRTYAGAYMPGEASALESSALAGVRVAYQVRPWLDVAANASGTRLTTRANFFPPAAFRFNERVELWDVRQDVILVHYGAEVGIHTQADALRPYASFGAGGYTMFLDAQANQSVQRLSGPQLTGALGVSYRVGERGGLNLEVRDHILLNYDRDRLNPVEPDKRDTVFLEHHPTPPAAKDQVHGLTLSVGFTYYP